MVVGSLVLLPSMHRFMNKNKKRPIGIAFIDTLLSKPIQHDFYHKPVRFRVHSVSWVGLLPLKEPKIGEPTLETKMEERCKNDIMYSKSTRQ